MLEHKCCVSKHCIIMTFPSKVEPSVKQKNVILAATADQNHPARLVHSVMENAMPKHCNRKKMLSHNGYASEAAIGRIAITMVCENA